jgi:hypothetical protein
LENCFDFSIRIFDYVFINILLNDSILLVRMADMQIISFEIHYGGQFVNSPIKNYINGVVLFVDDFDIDHLSFFGL